MHASCAPCRNGDMLLMRMDAPRVVPRRFWDSSKAVLAFASMWLVVNRRPRPTGTLPLVQSLERLYPSCAVRARQLTRANRPGTQESDTRRMVQFLNPWDWLNAQVRGLVLAASAWASPRGAGISSSRFTLSGGVGGGFRWYLPPGVTNGI